MIKEPQKLDLSFKKQPDGQHVCQVETKQGTITIVAGEYRLVYGVPRKFWPAPTPKGGIVLVENYEYELGKVMKKEFIQNVKNDYAKLGWGYREALEIRGQFNPQGACWDQGAEILFRISETGDTTWVGLPQWRFSLYQGDKLYDAAGQLVVHC